MKSSDSKNALIEITPDACGKDGTARLKRVENPAPNGSFGYASEVYAFDHETAEGPVRLAIPLDEKLLRERQLDPSATRLFRWDEGSGRFRIVPGSGPIRNGTLIAGEIVEAGLYTLVAASTNPAVAFAADLLSETAAGDWTVEHFTNANQQICEATLCRADSFAPFGADGETRYEPLPDLPKGVCQVCRDIVLPDRLPELEIFDEPEPPVSPFHGIFDRWMLSHPEIAYTTVWRQPSPENGAPTSYPNWHRNQKLELCKAFWKAVFHVTLDLPVTPLLDLITPDGNFVQATVYNRTQAWETYVAYAAQSLAVEYASRTPWSLLDYTDDERRMLLDSHSLFEYVYPYDVAGREGYVLWPKYGRVTPSDPVDTYLWLRNNVSLGANEQETIEAVLTWCHENLVHFVGGTTRANHQNHWQYDGWSPVLRVLEGTSHQWGPRSLGFAHWTAGCWGTTGLLRALLRTVNIPVELVERCAHALPYFVREDRYLSHGDDPYATFDGIPIDEILIDESTFDEWFGDDVDDDTLCGNIGRRPVELVLEHLPHRVLRLFCDDLANGRSHEDGRVFAYFSSKYSLDTLEAGDLWGRLEERVEALGGCEALPDS